MRMKLPIRKVVSIRTHVTTTPVVVEPIWIRLPKKKERCPYSGLSSTSLFELCVPTQRNGFKPPVRSVVEKKRHAVRGIRLINFRSLMDYVERLPTN